MKLLKLKGITNVTLLVFVQDSSATTGAGLTGVTASMLTGHYIRVEDDNDVTLTEFTISDIVGTGTVHTDGGIEEISGNVPGWYRLDIPDAAFATGASEVGISLVDAGSNDIAQVTIEIQLVDVDLTDTVRMGLTSLPNAVAEAAGGLYTRGTGAGQINQDVNGRVDSNVAATNSGVITATSIATDAIGSAELATTAVNEIRDAILSDSTAFNGADVAAILTDTGTTLDNHLTDIKGTGFVKDTHSLIDIETYVDLIDDGTSGLAKIATDVAAVLVDTSTTLQAELDGIQADTEDIQTKIGTAGAGLTDLGGMSTGMKAEVQTEANDALVANNLDHLMLTAVNTNFQTTVHEDSALGHIVQDTTGTGTGGGGFNRATDSLEALRDNQSGATAAAIADAVWDEAQSAHTTSGSFGETAAEIASILVDTAEIGTAGAGLSNISWNSAWDTEVQSEVNDGLVAFFTSSAQLVDNIWNETMAGHTTSDTSGEVMNDLQNGGRLDLIFDIIAVDTTTDIPALIATAQADLDTITGADGVNLLSATQTSINAIEADTNELQGDWVNGGRLDLLLDAIPTTAMRGTDSAALASVCTEARLVELASANIPADVDTLLSRLTAARAALLDEITAVRMATLTDWINGGRLDLIIDAVLVDTAVIGAAGAGLTDLGGMSTDMKAEVNTEVDGALNTAVPTSPTSNSINERIRTMDDGILNGTVDTATNTHTPTTTVFQADDITEATADHFIGRIVTFLSGVLANQSTDITDYEAVGGIAQFTVTALTEAPSNNDTFKIT
jgi:hypothetical protein